MDNTVDRTARVPNGAALAAVLGAGIGAFAMGVFVLANEAGVFTVPSVYGPAGGLSGRSTFAVVAWLVAWGVLHRGWARHNVRAGPVFGWTLLLIGCGLIATFPPFWRLL